MKESASLRFLYHTVPGRCVLKCLVHPAVSKIAGAYLDSSFSRWLIPGFMKKNDISLQGIEVPKKGFSSFNSFFMRKRVRLNIDKCEEHFISPCDGLLTVCKIKEGTVLDVKHTKFTVEQLLKNKELAKDYMEGYALVFRLTPTHYHRYIYTDHAVCKVSKRIDGVLHTVRPIALSSIPVFAQNSREYQVLDSDRWGRLVQMEVGAMLVGKITNRPIVPGESVKRGAEKGYFEFGGSTIIMLVQKDRLKLDKKVLVRKNPDGEIPVKIGECIGEMQ